MPMRTCGRRVAARHAEPREKAYQDGIGCSEATGRNRDELSEARNGERCERFGEVHLTSEASLDRQNRDEQHRKLRKLLGHVGTGDDCSPT
jgi:hypothetical protein